LLCLSYQSCYGLSCRVVYCDRVVIITKLLNSGVEVLRHLLIMTYFGRAVIVTKLRIITTSSMAYSVVDASEHLLIIIHDENLLYHCCFRLRDEYFRQRHGVFISRVDVSSSSSLRRDLSQKQHVAEIVMGILKKESIADLKGFCCSSFCRRACCHYTSNSSSWNSPVSQPFAVLPCCYCSSICAVHAIVNASALSAVAKVVYVDQLLQLLLQLEQQSQR